MQVTHTSSPMLQKYIKAWDKNPKSTVFAPLADLYRKMGKMEACFEVLKKGLKYHPNYDQALLTLGHYYFDQKKFDLAYNIIRPLIFGRGDNFYMQKLFATICEELNFEEEALNSYKTLLFLRPTDKFFQKKVKQLEAKISESRENFVLYHVNQEEKYPSNKRQDSIVGSLSNKDVLFNTQNLKKIKDYKDRPEEEWVTVELHTSRSEKNPVAQLPEGKIKNAEPLIQKNANDAKELEFSKTTEKTNHEIPLTLIKEESVTAPSPQANLTFTGAFPAEGSTSKLPLNSKLPLTSKLPESSLKPERPLPTNRPVTPAENDLALQSFPFSTHTLADIYLGQGHKDKALEILNNMLEKNPADQKTIEKIESLNSPRAEVSAHSALPNKSRKNVDLSHAKLVLNEFLLLSREKSRRYIQN